MNTMNTNTITLRAGTFIQRHTLDMGGVYAMPEYRLAKDGHIVAKGRCIVALPDRACLTRVHTREWCDQWEVTAPCKVDLMVDTVPEWDLPYWRDYDPAEPAPRCRVIRPA